MMASAAAEVQVELRELIFVMVRALVDLPEKVSVGFVAASPPCFRIGVAREDFGKVVGKQGRTAKSLRAIVSVAAQRRGMTVALDIYEI